MGTPPKEPQDPAATVPVVPADRPTPAQPVLLVLAHGTVTAHPLPSVGNLTIGRAPDSDVRIDDPSISRKHAVLSLAPLALEDLGGPNGTKLRGAPIAPGKPVAFSAGEVVDLGSVIVIVQDDPAAARPWRLWSHGYFEGRLDALCADATRPFAVLRVRATGKTDPAPLAAVVAEVAGPSDVAAAWGPHELELLLGDRAPAEAEAIAASLETALSARGVDARVGVACHPRDGLGSQVLLAHAGRATRAAAEPTGPDAQVVVADPAMQKVYGLLERVGPGTISVLLLGETGVGKEIVAEALHRLSPRAPRPFLRLNCAALSETLLESELFGHDKGAFTGATQAKPGLLETADGGTVFLDEVGELPPATQVKLLRVLETREVLRVGGLKSRPIDVRFVSATNRDLPAEVAKGAFRQDLLFRLNGVTVQVPPLRERTAEIEPLARGFLRATCRQLARSPAPALSPDALAFLRGYAWPGNVRELKNVIERAVLLCDGDAIELDHLPTEKASATFRASRPPSVVPAPAQAPAPAASTAPLKQDLDTLERERILEVLQRCAGNQTEAARQLGISRRTLTTRLTEYGVPRPRKGR